MLKKIKTLINLDWGWAAHYYPKKIWRFLSYRAAIVYKSYETVVIDGLELKLSFSHPTQYSFAKKIKQGRHENELLVMWKRNLEAGGAGDALDLGGYSGIFGLIAAKFKPSSRVYIFEPDAVNARHIEANIKLNDLANASLIKGAVTEKTGPVFFSEHQGGEAGSLANRGVKIDGYAIDDFIRQKKIKPAFIKLDVEGAEYFALLGMKNYLKQAESLNILLELHYDLIKKFNRTPDEVFKLLDDLGYKYIYLDKNRYNEHYWVYKNC